MSRQKSNRRHAATKKGYSLPVVVDPPETLCVCVPVPDEQFHRAAFLGQLYALGRAFTWGDDPDHTALVAAEVWYNIFINVRDQMAVSPRNCGCCDDDKIYRFDENGNLESSSDNGATWELDPGDDPRLNAPQFPPLSGPDGDDKKCTAANHITAQIKQSCDQLIADASLWSAITYLIAAITSILVFLSIFASGGVLTPLVVTAAGALLGFGQAAFAAAMTEEVYETIHCIFYCNMSPDGSINESQWQSIKTDITDQLTGIAATHLLNVVNIMGAVGLTNAGRTEGIAMDLPCDECGCSDGYPEIIWWEQPSEVTPGAVTYLGEGVYRVTSGTNNFGASVYNICSFRNAEPFDYCFKVTNMIWITGSECLPPNRRYRSLCGGGAGFGDFVADGAAIVSGSVDDYLCFTGPFEIEITVSF